VYGKKPAIKMDSNKDYIQQNVNWAIATLVGAKSDFGHFQLSAKHANGDI